MAPCNNRFHQAAWTSSSLLQPICQAAHWQKQPTSTSCFPNSSLCRFDSNSDAAFWKEANSSFQCHPLASAPKEGHPRKVPLMVPGRTSIPWGSAIFSIVSPPWNVKTWLAVSGTYQQMAWQNEMCKVDSRWRIQLFMSFEKNLFRVHTCYIHLSIVSLE